MMVSRLAISLLLGSGLMIGDAGRLSFAPAKAEAASRCGYDRHGRYRCHRGDGIDTGDVILGAIIIAGIAAVASAATKSDRDRNRDRDWGYGYGSGSRAERDAIDACAYEAERAARRYGSDARVRTIDDVDRDGSRYRVRGTVEVEDRPDWDDRDRDWDRDRDRNWNRDYGSSARFTCTAQAGHVTDFRFLDGFGYAWR